MNIKIEKYIFENRKSTHIVVWFIFVGLADSKQFERLVSRPNWSQITASSSFHVVIPIWMDLTASSQDQYLQKLC